MELHNNKKGATKNILSGNVGSKGYIEGKCFINDAGKIPPKDKGYILVSKFTNPELLPLMINAAGIITEIGGKLSHAAILARELGIPCAVAVENATKLLKDSDLVVLDAREIPAIVYKKENANILKILRE
jgi:pyruvate,water dikinase